MGKSDQTVWKVNFKLILPCKYIQEREQKLIIVFHPNHTCSSIVVTLVLSKKRCSDKQLL